MTIGIDLRPLQNGHRVRGVGEVAKQVANRVIAYGKADGVKFIFYEYEQADDPRKLLDIPKDLEFEVVKLGRLPEDPQHTKLDKLKRRMTNMFGNPIVDAHRSDAFLQFDYALGVPKDTRTVLIKHDIIPLIFWDKYFTSPLVHIRHKALRTTLRTIVDNYEYKRVLRRALKQADIIVANSAHTKKDVQRYFKVDEKRFRVAHLGVSVKPAKTHVKTDKVLPSKPYLLFVGGIDAGKRRAVDDLVAAFNNLKAAGHDIQLALVGENFPTPEGIGHEGVRAAVMNSSYKKDIFTLGYIDDATKQKLFKEALAFVYPTKYEGFGIPVLEAMLLESPVITYKNSSIPEVGGNFALYARDWKTIKEKVEVIKAMSKTDRTAFIAAAKKHAESFTWDSTAEAIYDELRSVAT